MARTTFSRLSVSPRSKKISLWPPLGREGSSSSLYLPYGQCYQPLPGAILTRQEKTVMGCYYGTSNPAVDFPKYANLYAIGKLDLGRLITRHYPLEQINEAYADMLSGTVARGVIVLRIPNAKGVVP